eukprot:2679138-Amphidinium_carterae.1
MSPNVWRGMKGCVSRTVIERPSWEARTSFFGSCCHSDVSEVAACTQQSFCNPHRNYHPTAIHYRINSPSPKT